MASNIYKVSKDLSSLLKNSKVISNNFNYTKGENRYHFSKSNLFHDKKQNPMALFLDNFSTKKLIEELFNTSKVSLTKVDKNLLFKVCDKTAYRGVETKEIIDLVTSQKFGKKGKMKKLDVSKGISYASYVQHNDMDEVYSLTGNPRIALIYAQRNTMPGINAIIQQVRALVTSPIHKIAQHHPEHFIKFDETYIENNISSESHVHKPPLSYDAAISQEEEIVVLSLHGVDISPDANSVTRILPVTAPGILNQLRIKGLSLLACPEGKVLTWDNPSCEYQPINFEVIALEAEDYIIYTQNMHKSGELDKDERPLHPEDLNTDILTKILKDCPKVSWGQNDGSYLRINSMPTKYSPGSTKAVNYLSQKIDDYIERLVVEVSNNESQDIKHMTLL